MVMNEELSGIELYFDNKPATQIINNLKINGFRWSGFKKCWYAKQNEKTLKHAQELSGAEQQETLTEQIQTPKKQNKNNTILPLFERVKFTPGTTDKSKYSYKFVGSNYTGLSTKETAKIIRQHLRGRFPEVKFSITSDYNRIDIEIKQSPYSNIKPDQNMNFAPFQYKEWEKENNLELASIKEYCEKLLRSYNYDDSDIQSDYFHTHYYDKVSIDYDYTQTEQIEVIKTDIADFRQKLEQQKIIEKEQKEVDFKEWQKQQEEQKKVDEERQKEEAKEIEVINNNIQVKELDKTQQYFVIGSQFAKLNKNNTLKQYKEEVEKGEFYFETVKITKEVHFQTEQALNYFSNLLLDDFNFLTETGGSYTDDVRVNSMIDYNNMDKEERETVIWNLYGVAIYYNNELKFIIDAQGHNYARYVGLVDGVTIQKENDLKQFINLEQLQELKNIAEILTDISTSIITEQDIIKTWDNENWQQYKKLMEEQLKKNNIKLSKANIQQINGEMDQLKIAMYKLLTEVDEIQKQFKNADLQQGQKITLFYLSDFGCMVVKRITFDSFESTKYAQYDKAIKITFKPENKRKLYYNYFYSTLLVYNGWLNLPEEVLHTVEQTGTGVIVTRSKYLSCDKRQYDEILNYYANNEIKPIINTYKPVF